MDHRQTFTELILPLKDNLFRFGYSFLRDRQKAEDIVQETMLRVWNCREKWQELGNIEGYCMGIVRNLCVDEIRRVKITLSNIEIASEVKTNDHSPVEVYSRKQLKITLDKTIQMLPEKQQQCFHLRESEGRSYDEIAEVLAISMEQVKVNLFRARNFIKKELLKQEEYGL